jgi:hypothetical protein
VGVISIVIGQIETAFGSSHVFDEENIFIYVLITVLWLGYIIIIIIIVVYFVALFHISYSC